MAHRRGAHHELSEWLDRHGYHHARGRKETPPPYARPTRVAHATWRDNEDNHDDADAFEDDDALEDDDNREDEHDHAACVFIGFCSARAAGSASSVNRALGHARKIESPATGRPLFPQKARGGKITTTGRLVLRREQFALAPGPEEKRRGIKGRLPIDTLRRARNALSRAAQMHKRGDITARQLNLVQHRVNRAFPEIHVSPIED